MKIALILGTQQGNVIKQKLMGYQDNLNIDAFEDIPTFINISLRMNSFYDRIVIISNRMTNTMSLNDLHQQWSRNKNTEIVLMCKKGQDEQLSSVYMDTFKAPNVTSLLMDSSTMKQVIEAVTVPIDNLNRLYNVNSNINGEFFNNYLESPNAQEQQPRQIQEPVPQPQQLTPQEEGQNLINQAKQLMDQGNQLIAQANATGDVNYYNQGMQLCNQAKEIYARGQQLLNTPVQQPPKQEKKKGLFGLFGKKDKGNNTPVQQNSQEQQIQQNQQNIPVQQNPPVQQNMQNQQNQQNFAFGGDISSQISQNLQNNNFVQPTQVESPQMELEVPNFISEPVVKENNFAFGTGNMMSEPIEANNFAFGTDNGVSEPTDANNFAFGDNNNVGVSEPVAEQSTESEFNTNNTNFANIPEISSSNEGVDNEKISENSEQSSNVDSGFMPISDVSNDFGFDTGIDKSSDSFEVNSQSTSSQQQNQTSTAFEQISPVKNDFESDKFDTDASFRDMTRQYSNASPLRTKNIIRQDVDEIDFTNIDIAGAENKYRQTNEGNTGGVRVVTKEVIRNIGNVKANVGTISNIYSGRSHKVIVVTGDRGSGITSTALSIAKYMSNKVPILYFDCDTENHGLLSYINYDTFRTYEQTHMEGIKRCRTRQAFMNCVVNYDNNFDILTTDYSCDASDDEINHAGGIVSEYIDDYGVVIVDCPVDKLYCISDLIISGTCVICTEATKRGFMNMLCRFENCSLDLRYKRTMVSKGTMFLTKYNKGMDLKKLHKFVKEIYQPQDVDWLSMPTSTFFGTLNDEFLNSVFEG